MFNSNSWVVNIIWTGHLENWTLFFGTFYFLSLLFLYIKEEKNELLILRYLENIQLFEIFIFKSFINSKFRLLKCMRIFYNVRTNDKSHHKLEIKYGGIYKYIF